MVSTWNTSKSHANPPRMQDQPGGVDSRPPGGTLETMQANTDEVEALRLTNQRLIGELEQLTRQMQRPLEARQTQEGHNTTPLEEQPHLSLPREAKAESSRARGHGPHLAPREERNEAILGGDIRNDEPTPSQQGMGGAIMRTEVQGYPTGAQPHEGSRKRPSTGLYGHPGAAN